MAWNRISRRSAVASGLAMLALPAAAAGSAKAAGLDGELIALCQESGELSSELAGIGDGLADMRSPEREVHPLRIRELEASARFCELREIIADLPARTPEGIQAKARVVLAEFRGEDEFEEYPGQYDPRGALALSLAQDLVGRAV